MAAVCIGQQLAGPLGEGAPRTWGRSCWVGLCRSEGQRRSFRVGPDLPKGPLCLQSECTGKILNSWREQGPNGSRNTGPPVRQVACPSTYTPTLSVGMVLLHFTSKSPAWLVPRVCPQYFLSGLMPWILLLQGYILHRTQTELKACPVTC